MRSTQGGHEFFNRDASIADQARNVPAPIRVDRDPKA